MVSKDIVIYIKPTEACNLHCKHCYNSIGDITSTLDIGKLSRFFRRMGEGLGKNSTDHGVDIIIHGGEPTLMGVEYLSDLVRMIQVNIPMTDIRFSMQSNLASIDDGIVKFIKEHLQNNIGTSYSPGLRFCDSDAKLFDCWKNNVKRLVAENASVYAVISLCKEAIETISAVEMYDFIVGMGFNGFHFEPLTQSGNAITNWDTISVKPHQHDKWKSEFAKLFIESRGYDIINNCEIVKKAKTFIDGRFVGCSCRDCMVNTITINSDGSIGACPNDSKIINLGDLDSNLDELFNSNARSCLIAKERLRRMECLDCQYMAVCNGGCMQLPGCYEGVEFFGVLEKFLSTNDRFRRAVNEYSRTGVFY